MTCELLLLKENEVEKIFGLESPGKVKPKINNFGKENVGIESLEKDTVDKENLGIESLEKDNVDKENLGINGFDKENLRRQLIESWFLVPEHFDEYDYAGKFRRVAELLQASKKGITGFRIFTTTDCNARCAYCYEAGCRKISMSDKTALDVTAYIEKVCEGQKIKVTWFGGEPLYNSRAIDVICKDLDRRGITYTSAMISNGYLFDGELVCKAINDWKLNHIQITLDGTQEVYNSTKAFIYKDPNPYERVLRNISLLTQEGVDVHIRLNLTPENTEDMIALIQELETRFKGEKKPMVYAALVKDYGHDIPSWSGTEEGLLAKGRLGDRLSCSDLGRKYYLTKKQRINQCMADNDRAVTIMPDGRLGKCEHYLDDCMIGSIYEEKIDKKRIAWWKEKIDCPACKTCPVYPSCISLKHCPANSDGCTDFRRKIILSNYKEQILNEYERYCDV